MGAKAVKVICGSRE